MCQHRTTGVHDISICNYLLLRLLYQHCCFKVLFFWFPWFLRFSKSSFTTTVPLHWYYNTCWLPECDCYSKHLWFVFFNNVYSYLNFSSATSYLCLHGLSSNKCAILYIRTLTQQVLLCFMINKYPNQLCMLKSDNIFVSNTSAHKYVDSLIFLKKNKNKKNKKKEKLFA